MHTIQVIKALLEERADPNITTHSSNTVLQTAASSDNHEVKAHTCPAVVRLP